MSRTKIKLTLTYEDNSEVFDWDYFGLDEDTKLEDLTEEQINDIRENHAQAELVGCIIEEVKEDDL